MARITVNDRLERVPNRFELVLLAAERARQMGRGETQAIEAAGEPQTLVSLREIAAGKVDVSAMRERLVRRLQRHGYEEIEFDAPRDATGLGLEPVGDDGEAIVATADQAKEEPRSHAA